MEEKTVAEYREVIAHCKDLFRKKTLDYGSSWRILRLPSLTDQIYIKAMRIRNIQQKGLQKVEEDIRNEFIGIINYSLISLIQLSLQEEERIQIPYQELEPTYDRWTEETLNLLTNKNHDYGEAWRKMRVSSITDIILMKILRLKQIEENEGKTLVSEGVQANYQDMINYAVFCLIKLGIKK